MKTKRILALLVLLALSLVLLVPARVSAAAYDIGVRIPVYTDSYSAAARTNVAGYYAPGQYHVFNTFNGMVNITRVPGQPGGWINPAENQPSAPARDPAPAPETPASVGTARANYYANMRTGPGVGYGIILTIP